MRDNHFIEKCSIIDAVVNSKLTIKNKTKLNSVPKFIQFQGS